MHLLVLNELSTSILYVCMHITTYNTNPYSWILFRNMWASHYQGCPHFYLQLSMFVFNTAYADWVYWLCSFLLMFLWGWRFIAETCRKIHVYGWFVILYKLCAFLYMFMIIVTMHGTNNIKSAYVTYFLICVNVTGAGMPRAT